jgi:serine/threonine protein kinase
MKDLSGSTHLPRNGSDHIVKVYAVAREKDSKLYFVMEYMDGGSLNQFLDQSSKNKGNAIISNTHRISPLIPEEKIRSIVSQCLLGLQHIHSFGYMHRDIKPENILMDSTGVVKIADFSLARKAVEMQHAPKFRKVSHASRANGTMTTYVSTRWYRAPELLHGDTVYTCAVDIFALGLVTAEIYSLQPLLQGQNDAHQKQLVAEVLGDDSSMTSLRMDEVRVEQGPTRSLEKRLSEALPMASDTACMFMANMLRLDPKRRTTAEEALADNTYFWPTFETRSRNYNPPHSVFSATTTPKSGPAGHVPLVTVSKEDRRRDALDDEPNDVARAFLFGESSDGLGRSICF